MKSIFSLSVLALAGSVFAQSSSSVSSSSASASATASISSSVAISSASGSLASSASSQPSSSGAKSASSTGSAAQAAATTGLSTSSTSSIPKNISAACSTYLTAFNSDSKIAACIGPLLKATADFTPGSEGAKTSTAAITASLKTLCNTSACSDVTIRTQLTDFYNACKEELTGANPNDFVKKTYDILYISNPLHDALCSKDNGEYCVLKITAPSTGSSNLSKGLTSDVPDVLQAAIDRVKKEGVTINSGLARRQNAEAVVSYSPNTSVWRETSLPFLFTISTLPAESLCSTCTSNILGAYASWESRVPYALGLINSPMIGNQADLWKDVKEKCGNTYMQAIYQSSSNAPAGTNAAGPTMSLSGSLIALLTLAISSWLML